MLNRLLNQRNVMLWANASIRSSASTLWPASLPLAVGVMVGCLLIWQLPATPSRWLLVATGITIFIVAVLFGVRLGRNGFSAIAGIFLGAALSGYAAHSQLQHQLADQWFERDIVLHAVVLNAPRLSFNRQQFDVLAVLRDAAGEADASMPVRVRLSWYDLNQHVAINQRWQFSVRLKRPRSLGNPGSRDRAKEFFRQQIVASGYVKNTTPAIRLGGATASADASLDWTAKLLEWRLTQSENLARLPIAGAHVGLVQALALGVTDNISYRTRDAMRRSGTAHLLAISGLHIGLVAGLGWIVARFVWRRCHWCRPVFSVDALGGAGALLLATTYAALAGFSLPTQRALIMLAVVLILSRWQRVVAPLTAWCWALVVVVAIDPLVVLSPGIWLSFGSVLSLVYLHAGRQTQSVPTGVSKRSVTHRWATLRNVMRMHVCLGMVMLPLSAWFFQQAVLVAPIANAVVVPLVSLLIVPGCLLVMVVMLFSPSAANLLLMVVQWLLEHVITLCEWFAGLPHATHHVALPTGFWWISVGGGLLLLLAPRGVPIRWMAWPLILPLVLFNAGQTRQTEALQVHVLDVGQGLAVLVLTPSETLLYDTGGRLGTHLDMVGAVVLPFLRTQGRQRIDRLVVSHGDSDHAAGAATVRRHHPDVKMFSSAAVLQEAGAAACEAGVSWVVDEVHFAFIHPGRQDYFQGNNGSCVLLVHYGASRILLTGDIETAAEQQLVARLGEMPVNLMTAPHHGSRTSSTVALLDALQPRHVVFAAGADNAFGFPHPEVQLRYKYFGAKGFTTGVHGALSFQFDRIGLTQSPSAYWHMRRRLWHQQQTSE